MKAETIRCEIETPRGSLLEMLTVQDGSISTVQLADGGVTQAKAPFAPLTFLNLDSTPEHNVRIAAETFVWDLAGANVKEVDISP